jgi:hypothetical protein
MKAVDTLIAWNGLSCGHHGRPGSVAVGPYRGETSFIWQYDYTDGGRVFVWGRRLRGMGLQLRILAEWQMLVYSYGIDPEVAHRAFLLIDEYRAAIGPGFRSGVGPGPEIEIVKEGRVTHFHPLWPAVADRADASG